MRPPAAPVQSRRLRPPPPAVGPVCPEPLEAQPDHRRLHSGSPGSGWSGGLRSPRCCPMVKSPEFNGLRENDGGKSKGTEGGEREEGAKPVAPTWTGVPGTGVRALYVAAAAEGTEHSGCGTRRRAAAPQLLPKFHPPRGVAGVLPGAAGTGRGFSSFRLSLSAFRVPSASGTENKRAPAKEIMRVSKERNSGLERSGVSRLRQLCAPAGRGLPWTGNCGRRLC